MLMDSLMENPIAKIAQENNAEIIVEDLFLINQLMIQIQEVMMQEAQIIGKKILILEFIEMLKLSMQ
jgi:hypothetical protein